MKNPSSSSLPPFERAGGNAPVLSPLSSVPGSGVCSDASVLQLSQASIKYSLIQQQDLEMTSLRAPPACGI